MAKSFLSVLLAPLVFAFGFGIFEAVYFTVREMAWFLFEIIGGLMAFHCAVSLMVMGAVAGMPSPYGRSWLFPPCFICGALIMAGAEGYLGFFDGFVESDPQLWAFFFGGLCMGPFLESLAASLARIPEEKGIRLSAAGAVFGTAGFAGIAYFLDLFSRKGCPQMDQLLVFILVHTGLCLFFRSPAIAIKRPAKQSPG